MNKLNRLYFLLLNKKFRKLWAFSLYTIFIISFLEIPLFSNLPAVFNLLIFLIVFIDSICFVFYFSHYLVSLNSKINYKKEFIYFIVYYIIYNFVVSFMMVDIPPDQLEIREIIYSNPMVAFFIIVIFEPMIEEMFFRFLPSVCIDNKVLYILISSVVFALPHVLNDPNILYNIWPFIFSGMYLAYRYYKTKNIFVSMLIHSSKNLIAFIVILLF